MEPKDNNERRKSTDRNYHFGRHTEESDVASMATNGADWDELKRENEDLKECLEQNDQ